MSASCIEAVFRTLQSHGVGQDITRRTFEILRQALPPSRLPDVMHMTLSPRPSPSVFAYCKRSKTGGRNGLGTRLRMFTEYILAHSRANSRSGEGLGMSQVASMQRQLNDYAMANSLLFNYLCNSETT